MTSVKSKLQMGSLDGTLNNVPYALTISDLSQEDDPLVFMNRKFREMTGCTDAHLGRNCRFLQAELENDQARAEIKLALRERRRTQVILRNRRTNGDLFHNMLLLEPIRPNQKFGELALGAQFELSPQEVSEAAQDIKYDPQSMITAAQQTSLSLRLERRRIAASSAVQLLQSWMTLNSL